MSISDNNSNYNRIGGGYVKTMEKKYIVKAGGFYTAVYNSRTKRFKWTRSDKLDTLKRTETYLLTEEQARLVEHNNNNSYMKMANLTIEEYKGE